MQCKTQAFNLATNLKVKIYFILPEFSAKKIVTWECRVNDSTKGINNMILGRYIFTELVLNLKIS